MKLLFIYIILIIVLLGSITLLVSKEKPKVNYTIELKYCDGEKEIVLIEGTTVTKFGIENYDVAVPTFKVFQAQYAYNYLNVCNYRIIKKEDIKTNLKKYE